MLSSYGAVDCTHIAIKAHKQ